MLKIEFVPPYLQLKDSASQNVWMVTAQYLESAAAARDGKEKPVIKKVQTDIQL